VCLIPACSIISALDASDLGRAKQTGRRYHPVRGKHFYQRLVQPLLLAALNVDPPEGLRGALPAPGGAGKTLLAGGAGLPGR